MREYSSPLTVEIPTCGNLTDHIVRNAAEDPDRVSLSRRTDSGWTDVSAGQFLDEVRRTAKGLIAAGIAEGDRVALLSKTRYEWTLLDYAIWFAGAITVPIYETSSQQQIEWILSDSGASGVVAETAAHADRVRDAQDATDNKGHVWVLEEGGVTALQAEGTTVSDEELEARRTAADPDSPATIVYTSGTTGRPKGCILTHHNFMFELGVALHELDDLFEVEDASTLLFLPLAHVFARIIQIGAIKARVSLDHTSDIKNLVEALQTFQPTFILAVPRVFEKLFNTASQRAVADGHGRVFDAAANTAIAYSKALDQRPGLLLRARHSVFDRLVYSKLREALGGRCGYAISGGARSVSGLGTSTAAPGSTSSRATASPRPRRPLRRTAPP